MRVCGPLVMLTADSDSPAFTLVLYHTTRQADHHVQHFTRRRLCIRMSMEGTYCGMSKWKQLCCCSRYFILIFFFLSSGAWSLTDNSKPHTLHFMADGYIFLGRSTSLYFFWKTSSLLWVGRSTFGNWAEKSSVSWETTGYILSDVDKAPFFPFFCFFRLDELVILRGFFPAPKIFSGIKFSFRLDSLTSIGKK